MQQYDLAQLKADLAEMDAKRAPLAALISAIEAYERSQSGDPEPPVQPRLRLRVRPAPIMAATEKAVDQALQSAGEPMSIAELLEAMDREALNLAGDGASNVLSARLSNSTKFTGHRGIGWWYADKELP